MGLECGVGCGWPFWVVERVKADEGRFELHKVADCLNQVAENKRLKGLGARVWGVSSPIMLSCYQYIDNSRATKPGVWYLVFCYGTTRNVIKKSD